MSHVKGIVRPNRGKKALPDADSNQSFFLAGITYLVSGSDDKIHCSYRRSK